MSRARPVLAAVGGGGSSWAFEPARRAGVRRCVLASRALPRAALSGWASSLCASARRPPLLQLPDVLLLGGPQDHGHHPASALSLESARTLFPPLAPKHESESLSQQLLQNPVLLLILSETIVEYLVM